MNISPARFRERGIATGELGISAVILLVVGLLIARGCANRTRDALDCVALAAQGTASKDKPCPVSDARFTDAASCPDPDRHLQWPPRFEKGPGGMRAVQDLPATATGPLLEVGRTASFIAAREHGRGAVVDVRPRIWWRYIVGPLVQILCVLYIVAFFFQLNPKDRAPNGVIVLSLIAAGLAGWILWNSVPTVEGSQALRFDPATRQVIRHRYLFGKELAPEVYDGQGLAFVRVRSGSCSLVLVHPSSGGIRSTELIDGLSEKHVALGAWIGSRY